MMTMKWWDDLWLNEGFGNTLMYYAIAHVYPEWNAVSFLVQYSVWSSPPTYQLLYKLGHYRVEEVSVSRIVYSLTCS